MLLLRSLAVKEVPMAPLSNVITGSTSNWLFYVRDNGVPPWTGSALVNGAAQFTLGTPLSTPPVEKNIQFVSEWDYSGMEIPSGGNDGSGLPRLNFPCFSTPQGSAAPASEEQALQRIQAYYQARVAAAGNASSLIISLVGHFFFQHLGALWGADRVMSEVGENINSSQAHIAFTRGASRQFGIPWGIDMSSWFGPSIRDYSTQKVWGSNSYTTGGHSDSLTSRTYFSSFVGGAELMMDEAGSVNFFNGETLPLSLSSLGSVAQDFNLYVQNHPNRGTPFIPIAIIMDIYHGMGLSWWNSGLNWDTFSLDTSRLFTKSLHETLWPNSWSVGGGNESGYLVPTPFGDSFDVYLENMSASILLTYGYKVVIATGHLANNQTLIGILKAFVNSGGVLVLDSTTYALPFLTAMSTQPVSQPIAQNVPVSSAYQFSVGAGTVAVIADSSQWSNVLKFVYPKSSPFTVTGSVEYSFNWLGDHWMVTLINDLGITKQPTTAEVVDSSQNQTVSVSVRSGSITQMAANRCSAPTQTSAAQFTISVPAGEVCIYEFYTPGMIF